MALADIINKIEADACAEADRILAVADARAAEIDADAEARAQAHDEATMAVAQADASREVSRIVVTAKLSARDSALARRHELVDEVLSATADSVAALSDADYATFLARRVIEVARGGETLCMGAMDAGRADAVIEALRMLAPGLNVTLSAEPADFDRGVLVQGDRIRADLSIVTLVRERRDELELAIAAVLFAEGA